MSCQVVFKQVFKDGKLADETKSTRILYENTGGDLAKAVWEDGTEWFIPTFCHRDFIGI